MATIIDCGNGRHIAGDPDTTLHDGNHWCDYCTGSGLDYYDEELTVCAACSGGGQITCDDPDCEDHRP